MTRSIVAVSTVIAAVLGVLASPAVAKDGEGVGYADLNDVFPNFLISAGVLVAILVLTALLGTVTRKRSQAKAR
jgi:hypothetical protein